ncbi:hypothetical protein SDRG_13512 [Saprolegnia diclina VS20]|uniref:Uncharacterized protein n=1 Tax=Saprolegnia diclina (strain VS20) TaxID=1156394 RepID=T0RGJ8_SAPDV|nr:hypothetical protein SDRG_13512 [Saprolegnia diclina VS20]EQC28832.1 hypothetical protein SDRG_13512 [Saprolegnia diclina VS20]|eukprot:XP_008617827.1 hypothetical protein SDRG_13512 [Saprolegnia diclina VS20]
MDSVAGHVLRAPRMLRRICVYQASAGKMTLSSPLRCGAVSLTSYTDEPPHPDDATTMRSWIAVHGIDGLASLCVPHLFAYALSCGDAQVLDWLVVQGYVTWTKELLLLHTHDCNMCLGARKDLGAATTMRALGCVAHATEKGHVAMLQLLYENGMSVAGIWKAVCAGGDRRIAKYVVANALDAWDDACINVAAANGHFALVRYFLRLGYTGVDRRTLALAVQHDQLETVQVLLAQDRRTRLFFADALRGAVEYRRLNLLRWLCRQPAAQAFLKATNALAEYFCAPAAIRQCLCDAISQHALDMCMCSVLVSTSLFPTIASYQDGLDGRTFDLHELCSRGLALYRNYDRESPASCMYGAYHERFGHWRARHGLSQLRDLCVPHLFAFAMAYGNAEVLQALGPQLLSSQRRVELSCRHHRMCGYAKDQLDHRKIAYSTVVMHAAESGHVDLLAMLHAAGFSMENVWHRVSFFGHLNIAQFAHEHQLPGWQRNFVYTTAASGHLDVVQFYHEHNYDGFDDDTICGAVYSGNLALVQFLVAHRPTEDMLHKAMMIAVDKDNVPMLRWLIDQPGAASHVVWTAGRAYISQSSQCAALLANDPRTTPATMSLYARARKRKASAMM